MKDRRRVKYKRKDYNKQHYRKSLDRATYLDKTNFQKHRFQIRHGKKLARNCYQHRWRKTKNLSRASSSVLFCNADTMLTTTSSHIYI